MMKFVIYREVEIGGAKKRKALIQWDQGAIETELLKSAAKHLPVEVKPLVITKIFQDVIAKFKKETIKIP